MCKITYHITATLLLILLTNQVICNVKADFDPNVLCTYVQNGTQLKDPNACNTYITCVDQKPITGTCGNQFYDRNTRSCVDPSSVKCYTTNPCATIPGVDGFASDPYSCNGYYYCIDGKGSLGYCTGGSNFNPETEKCVRNYACSITILPEDYCNIVPDGVFIKDPDSCTTYDLCWQGTLLNSTCPEGFYFNAFTGECDYPTNVDCVAETTTTKPDVPQNVECTKSGVFIADGRTCNGYYYCRGNSDGTIDLLHGECPVDRFFDPANDGACVVRTKIACSFDRCVTMGLEYIQLANINNDGCTGFSLCQNGEEIATSSCPTGEYFDEMSQLCTNETISYAACALDNLLTTTINPDTEAE